MAAWSRRDGRNRTLQSDGREKVLSSLRDFRAASTAPSDESLGYFRSSLRDAETRDETTEELSSFRRQTGLPEKSNSSPFRFRVIGVFSGLSFGCRAQRKPEIGASSRRLLRFLERLVVDASARLWHWLLLSILLQTHPFTVTTRPRLVPCRDVVEPMMS